MDTLTETRLLEFLRKSKGRHLDLNKVLKEYFGKAPNRKKKRNKNFQLER